MKKVLLPTDLTVQSLKPVHDIVKDANGEKTKIFIIHLLTPPTSITELLFANQNKPFGDVPENFKDALQMLSNKYQDVLTIVFDFVYYGSSRYLNNLIEGNEINDVYLLDNYQYKETLRQSLNPTKYVSKCKVPLHKLQVQQGASSEYQNLSLLLNTVEKVKTPPANRVGKTTISYS